MPVLHPTERRLAEFVLDFPGEIASYPASELAQLANVSNATVSRFINSGYDDARRSVRTEKGTGSPLFLATGPGDSGQPSRAHVEQGRENISRTFARVPDGEIDAIAEAMLAARKVWIIGFRTSHSFATYLRWQTIQVIENVLVVPSAGETLPGTLSAQQSPIPPAEVPQASPSAPQGEPDDDWDWRRWPHQMREWMMTQDWDPRHMMEWRGNRGPGMMWGGGPPMHSGMMPMVIMAMMDTDENGSLSYEEVEVVHRRMFNLVDKDKNGELSPEEIQEAMGWHSGPRSG